MSRRVIGPFIFLFLVSIPGLVAGQGTSIPRVTQDVVVSSTLSPVPLESITRTVSVLTREDLDQMGLTSVVEALRLVPGVDPRARGPRDVQTDFSIRGATFGQSLVLVDGVRLNDSQSGHHNGEIPTPLVAVDRIEVVAGGGSAVHGADALGGTINVISRAGTFRTFDLAAGQHGYFTGQAALSGGVLPDNWMVTGWGNRSDGFMFDREFAQGGAALRGSLADGLILDVRHQRRAFGANGFYGASPSKEWTDQTIAATSWQRELGAWTTLARGSYRNHGDHFRWDINRPGFAENRHRTNAVEASLLLERGLGAGRRLTFGGISGGDWVRSSNLGDHDFARTGIFTEIFLPVSARATLQAGLRWDYYSSFGGTTSPSISGAVWLTPAVRLRGSAAHAFRIPTFTELYYTDPANLGSPDLTAEQGWSVDGGMDVIAGGWTFGVSPFRRWDEDVIDWVRPTTADIWRSTNVRDVTATGVELSVLRRWKSAYARAYYAALDIETPSLDLLSKYVREYATDQAGGSVSVPVGPGFRASINLDYRKRLDGQEYTLAAMRVSYAVRRVTVYVDGSNLFDESYREVAGVDMPGRWLTVGFEIR